MRLLMLNNEFPPIGGGTGTVNQALLNSLAHVPDLEIDLITSAVGKEFHKRGLTEHIRILRLTVGRTNVHHAANQELLVYSYKALNLALGLHRQAPFDLVFAWSAVPAGGVAYALRKLTGLRYLVRVCGPDIPGFERRYGPLYPILTPAIRRVWHAAEEVIAKCEDEARMIQAVDNRIKVTLVPNGVDLASFPQTASIPDEGSLKLLCVARLIERKGQRDLIEAVKRLVGEGIDVTLDLVGEGDAEASYREQVQQAGLSDRVHFQGYVPREEIAQIYAQAHIFVLPSFNEGMSLSTLEAMASGLPLIITHSGATGGLVDEGVNGFLFDWGDVDALVRSIRDLALNRAQARRMGFASRQRSTNFSWDNTVFSYITLLNHYQPIQTNFASEKKPVFMEES